MGPRGPGYGATSPPEGALQRSGNIVSEAAVARWRRTRRGLGPRALAAQGLAQRADQHRRAARPTPVEIRAPVVRDLAPGADEHLLVRDDPALPRARSLPGIRLPRT